MAKCDYCGTSILFGGVKDNDLRFCNENCHQQGYLLAVADQVPYEVMSQQVAEVHQGDCPKCGGPGPIDVHTSYTVWSALVLTSWQSKPEVACNRCGRNSKIGAAFLSGIIGWWGIPWGIVFTPIQIGRNVIGLFSSPNPMTPSHELENIVKIHLAAHLMATSEEEAAEAEIVSE